MAIVTTALRRGRCWRDTLHLQLRNEEQLGSVLSACAEARLGSTETVGRIGTVVTLSRKQVDLIFSRLAWLGRWFILTKMVLLLLLL